MKHKKKLALATITILLLALVLVFQDRSAWRAYAGKVDPKPGNEAGVALDRPDVLIRSQSLTALPKDLLQVPLLKDVLTEDLLFYYDNDEDWLGLKGTLRRIAYEHDLDLNDKLLALLLSRPTDVYLWRDDKGALRRYALALQGNMLTALAASVAKVVEGEDKQLSRLGSFNIGQTEVPVYRLTLSPRRSYVLVFFQDRLAVLSDPDLALKKANKDGQTSAELYPGFIAAATRWLAPEEKDRLGQFEGYPLVAEGSKHSILASSRFLSQGYSGFFPGIAALRFDFNNEQWTTRGLLDLPAQQPAALFNADIWKQVPVNAASCVLVPTDWNRLSRLLPDDGSVDAGKLRRLTSQLQASGAACWYAGAKLYEPLFIAAFREPADSKYDATLAQVFDWSAGSSKDKNGERRRKVDTVQQDGAVLWRRHKPVINNTANPILVRAGSTLYFSGNANLIHQALAVQGQRFPAQADTLPAANSGVVLLHTDMTQLSLLLGQQMDDLTEKGSDDAAIVHTRLTPRLQAMAKHGQVDLLLPTAALHGGKDWYPLQWQEH
jgi:uncharacterized protein YfaA (DUF2138 family)